MRFYIVHAQTPATKKTFIFDVMFDAGFVGVRVLTPEEIVDATENGKKVIVQLGFYTVFTLLLSICALYRSPGTAAAAQPGQGH
jgi:succinate-acetate transporter protein